jgi:ribonuclease HIII
MTIFQSLHIPDADLRERIRQALEHLGPSDRKTDPYCDYVFLFEDKPERLVVKQYRKGTLTIQGRADHLFQVITQVIAPFTGAENRTDAAGSRPEPLEPVPLPYIGTDESGKGDYFGPMIVAGVMVDEALKPRLDALGIRDSKQLSDARCRDLAARIRKICVRRYYEVVLPPERYNELYGAFAGEGKNLNHLLAWAHARAIESLLDYADCPRAVADQFGNEQYIRSRLMKKGRTLQLIQLHRGERYLAVAAASILARDRFLEYLDRLSRTYGIALPKGAVNGIVAAARQFLEKHGAAQLGRVAKLHHKTTDRVLAP